MPIITGFQTRKGLASPAGWNRNTTMDERINLVGGHSHGFQVVRTGEPLVRLRDLDTGEVEIYREVTYPGDDGPRFAYVAMDLCDTIAISMDEALRVAPTECW